MSKAQLDICKIKDCNEPTIPKCNLCRKHFLEDKRLRYHQKYKHRKFVKGQSLSQQLIEEKKRLGFL